MSVVIRSKRSKVDPFVDDVLDILATSEKVSAIDAQIAMAKLHLKELIQKRKTFVNTKGILRKAKSIYYHENKERPEIIKDVTGRLETAGLYVVKASGKPMIPWRIIREYTDREFDLLDTKDKRDYVAGAGAYGSAGAAGARARAITLFRTIPKCTIIIFNITEWSVDIRYFIVYTTRTGRQCKVLKGHRTQPCRDYE